MQLILSLFLAVNTHFIVISSQLGLFFYILSTGVQIKVDVSDGWLRLNTSVPHQWCIVGNNGTVQDY